MEFIAFLDKVEIEIIRLVEKAGYKTEENTPLCLLGKDYVGFLKKRQKTIVICTTNAMERENYNVIRHNNKYAYEKTAINIKKALRHEAVHVAQECNNGNLLKINKKYILNPAKLNALRGSTKFSGETGKEIEAYILEDKPRLVRKILKEYCL